MTKHLRTPLRASALRRWRRPGLLRRGRQLWERLLEVHALWVVVFLLAGTWCLTPAGTLFVGALGEGEIANRDHVAPRNLLLLDEQTTRDKQARAEELVLPVYDFDPARAQDAEQRLRRFFETGREALLRGGGRLAPADADALAAASGLTLTPGQAQMLARQRFDADLGERTAQLVGRLLRRGVVGGKALLLEEGRRGVAVRDLASALEEVRLDLYAYLGYPDEVREFLRQELDDWQGVAPRDRQALRELVVANLAPNLNLNRSETLSRRAAAVAATEPVYSQVLKGQVIVRKGDRIDAAAARLLRAISGERLGRRRVLVILGNALLLTLASWALWLGLRQEPPAAAVSRHGHRRRFGESLLLLVASLLGARFGLVLAGALAGSFTSAPFTSAQSYSHAVPFAALAFLAALFYGRGPATLLAVLHGLLIGRLLGPEGLGGAIYAVAGGLAAVFALARIPFKQRSVSTQVGLLVGLVNLLVVLMLAALAAEAPSPAELGWDLACALAGGLLVTAVVSFAVPILESIFGYTTDVKLMELANTNLPLLRRLALEAPGTFQHSLAVANLAKVGCEAVGADPVLAYTGGLYHDVGKVFRPEYFVENQRPGQNPHDKLLPSMSALVLVNHIKEGLELAEQYGLPQPLHDAVAQHHGTRLMAYFFNRALEQAPPGGDPPAEEAFRYPGPRPQHRVMGVLMLADAVEAASRTLVDPNPARIRAMIRAIVQDCLRDGQLDDTDLTLGEVKAVGGAFERALASLFHRRLDYPGFDFNAAPAARPSRPAAVADAGPER
jgi:putative nucleotidyltransferase with HDIG domain